MNTGDSTAKSIVAAANRRLKLAYSIGCDYMILPELAEYDEAIMWMKPWLSMRTIGLSVFLACICCLLQACLRDRQEERREIIRLMDSARKAPRVQFVSVELGIFHGRVYTARCEVSGAKGTIPISQNLLPGPEWREGYDPAVAESQHLKPLTERMTYLGQAYDFRLLLTTRGRMSDRGPYVTFRLPIRVWWGRRIGDYERGIVKESGLTVWTARYADGYTDLVVYPIVESTGSIKALLRPGTEAVRGELEMLRVVRKWASVMPILATLVPSLAG